MALADAAAHAGDAAHPADERSHVALWDGFLEAFGGDAGDATRYFDLHAVLYHEHAAHARAELEATMAPADEDRLLAEAERVLQANWRLLDGVQERASAVA